MFFLLCLSCPFYWVYSFHDVDFFFWLKLDLKSCYVFVNNQVHLVEVGVGFASIVNSICSVPP